jgi:transcriptional regulator with XRE-family HTH domain
MQHERDTPDTAGLSAPVGPGLGDFLRTRRERLSAAECGLTRISARRRTPGLRREEVAELAGISSAWYANLEARKVQPSTATLLAIAMALRLTDAESDYLFELAGLAAPLRYRDPLPTIPEALRAVIAESPHCATLYDSYFTPVLWNDVADGLFGLDPAASDFDRNFIVRGLVDRRFIDLFGASFATIAVRSVGTFRRALATHRPSPHGQRVYEFASGYAFFRNAWNEQLIVDGITDPVPFERYHHVVGTVRLESTDLHVGANNDANLRILTPCDAETAAKFDLLRARGKTYVDARQAG